MNHKVSIDSCAISTVTLQQISFKEFYVQIFQNTTIVATPTKTNILDVTIAIASIVDTVTV